MALGTWKQVFKGAFGFIIMVDFLRGNRCFSFFFKKQTLYVTEVDMDILLLLIIIDKMINGG